MQILGQLLFLMLVGGIERLIKLAGGRRDRLSMPPPALPVQAPIDFSCDYCGTVHHGGRCPSCGAHRSQTEMSALEPVWVGTGVRK